MLFTSPPKKDQWETQWCEIDIRAGFCQHACNTPPQPFTSSPDSVPVVTVAGLGLVVSPPSAGGHGVQMAKGGWRMRGHWPFRGPFSTPDSYLLARQRRGLPLCVRAHV